MASVVRPAKMAQAASIPVLPAGVDHVPVACGGRESEYVVLVVLKLQINGDVAGVSIWIVDVDQIDFARPSQLSVVLCRGEQADDNPLCADL